MVKLLAAAATLSVCALAADVSGKWIGTVNTNGDAVPLYLALTQDGRQVSGRMGRDETKTVPIEKVELKDDLLTFEAQGTSVSLHLAGGALYGEARAGETASKVALYAAQNTDWRNTFESGASTGPVVARRVEPSYSEEARAAKLQGTVTLRVPVGADGLVAAPIRVLRGLGMGLDEKAIEAVKQWRFKPAYHRGTPVPIEVTIEISFRLR